MGKKNYVSLIEVENLFLLKRVKSTREHTVCVSEMYFHIDWSGEINCNLKVPQF